MNPLRVSASMTCTTAEQVARAAEALSRALAGLALDGLEVCLLIYPDEDES